MRWLSLLAGLLLLAALLSSVTYAQRSVSDDEVNAVAKKLYCPVCENTPLDVCPTQVCKDWRELIRQQLGEGWTEEQILDYFSANYGARVLAQPPAQGFTALVWILPVIGLAGGGVFLWRLLRRGQDRGPSNKGSGEALDGLGRVFARTAHERRAEEPVAADEATGPQGVSTEMLDRIEREVESRF